MFTKPSFDYGTLLTLFCILFALAIASVLGGCTTAQAPTYSHTVGDHHHSHDARTKLQEPKPSRIR